MYKEKQYIDTIVLWKNDTTLVPLYIIYNEHPYSIDKILKEPHQSASSAGGQGLKYVCLIANKKTNLFYDKMREKWFIEIPNF